jgi:hypothetical protein
MASSATRAQASATGRIGLNFIVIARTVKDKHPLPADSLRRLAGKRTPAQSFRLPSFSALFIVRGDEKYHSSN